MATLSVSRKGLLTSILLDPSRTVRPRTPARLERKEGNIAWFDSSATLVLLMASRSGLSDHGVTIGFDVRDGGVVVGVSVGVAVGVMVA